ncbi:MAG: hypothetical protein ACI90V_005047 [Bacillariaceae sp.]|jgi:hypothetical protein
MSSSSPGISAKDFLSVPPNTLLNSYFNRDHPTQTKQCRLTDQRVMLSDLTIDNMIILDRVSFFSFTILLKMHCYSVLIRGTLNKVHTIFQVICFFSFSQENTPPSNLVYYTDLVNFWFVILRSSFSLQY